MIKALLFDLDGTLFDNTTANIVAYTEAFAAAGVAFDQEAYRSLFGLRFEEMMHQVAPDATDELKAQIKSVKAERYKANMHLVRANEGLLELLKSIQGTFKTALVTTASKPNVMNLLKHFEVAPELFTIIVTGEDVALGKPDPECYNIAINSLGVRAEECCIFEDSPVGLEAAQRVGASYIKVAF